MRTKTISSIVFILLSPLASSGAPTPSAAHWSMDDTQGITAKDSLGSNDGTLCSGAIFSADSRVGTGSVQLDGFDDYIRVPNASELNPTTAITITAWVNADTWDKKNARIIQKGNSDNQYKLSSEWGKLIFDLRDAGKLSVSLPDTRKWVHIAASYDGLQMRIYYDGNLTGSKPACGQIATTDDSLYIGAKDGSRPMDSFKGRLDDVAVLGWAFTPNQITQLYSRGVASYLNSQPAGGTTDNHAIVSKIGLAISNIQKGDQSAADNAVKELLASSDENMTPAILAVADAYLRQKKYSQALDLYQTALTTNHSQPAQDIQAYKGQALSSIELGRMDSAANDAAKILDAYSEQEDSVVAVYQIADAYYAKQKSADAVKLYKDIAERWPETEQAIWSCVKVIKHYVSIDESLSDAQLEKLLSLPTGHPLYPAGIREAANQYMNAGLHDKARSLHQYNVEHFTDSMYAMWSQGALIHSLIRDGEYDAADKAYAKFLTTFPQQPTFLQEVYQVADVYSSVGRYDKAAPLYQYVLDHRPESKEELWARVGMIKVSIASGNETAVQQGTDKLIADFKDNTDLPKAVFQVGEQYWNMALFERRKADPAQGLSNKARDYFAKALTVWERIITELPKSDSTATSHAHYFSAVCYCKLGNQEKAVEYFQKVVDSWPDYQYAWSAQCLIGECYEKLRDSGGISKAEAEPKIEQAYQAVIVKYPDCSLVGHACLKLGDMYLQKDRRNEASMCLELFLMTANPSDPRINTIKVRLERLGGQTK